MRRNKGKVSHGGEENPRILLVLVSFMVMSLLISAGNRVSQEDVLKPEQSTTGPIPAPQIDLEGHVFDEIQLQAATKISGVPTYIWQHGCGPTAVGMILGYHDGHGFPRLIRGDASFQGDNVNSAIASIEHYNDYCLPLDYEPRLLPDKSEPPFGDEHKDNCIADYMKTSQSYYKNYYGWSWDIHIKPSLEDYVSAVGRYSCAAKRYDFLDFSWDLLKKEIDNKRPLVFLVDTDGDGNTDHFIAIVGYNSSGGTMYYGCYNTWDSNIHWYKFQVMTKGRSWGVYSIVTFDIRSAIYPPKDTNLERLENNLIFFKEYINRISWAADERNKGISLESLLFRKLKGTSDATYELISTFNSTDITYDDRGLKQLDYYTYKVIFKDPKGRKSDPVVVSN